MSLMRSGCTRAQEFCVVAGLVLVAFGFVRLSALHIATGLVLLVGATRARAARIALVVSGFAYAVVAFLGWLGGASTGDNVLHTAFACLALAAAVAPAPASRPIVAPGLPPAGSAYDASSAKQVFVGLRD
jgi:hypothetical protein